MFCLHPVSLSSPSGGHRAERHKKTSSASPMAGDDEEASKQLDSLLIFPRSRHTSGLGAGIGTLSSAINCLAERLPRFLRASPSTALDELFPETFQGTRGTISKNKRL